MPPKRKNATTSPAGPAPKRTSSRIRQPPRRPGDDNAGPPTLPTDRDNPAAGAEFTTALEAHCREADGRFTEFDAALQANTQQLNDIAMVLNDIRQRMSPAPNQSGSDRLTGVSASAAVLSGNEPLAV